jgi:hypothetical protein
VNVACWQSVPVKSASIRDASAVPTLPNVLHGERRTNATDASTTDPDARLYKKARGREARLGYVGHVLMEHRSGLIVDAR